MTRRRLRGHTTAPILLLLVVAVAALAPARAAAEPVNALLPWHDAVLDAGGRLLAWHEPRAGRGYDRVLRDGWTFLERRVPADTVGGTGLPVYLVNAVYDPATLQGIYWQHNPVGVYATLTDSLVGWYPYSGDARAIAVVRRMLDYQLAHGTTPAGWAWPRVPFFTSCAFAREYGGCAPGFAPDYRAAVQPDKVAEMGTAYALFHQLTGERRYLRAALDCARALARHARPGDAARTPWPFRVDGRTGATLAGEEYGGLVVAAVRLFDELERMRAGDLRAWRRARAEAWGWLLGHPLNPRSPAFNRWSGYFEDVPQLAANVNQVLPTMTAYYLLTHPAPHTVDRRWREHARELLAWPLRTFGRGPFHGAWAIDEQGVPGGSFGCCSPAGLGSHTSRWAAVDALFYERTGDRQAEALAFRSLNYATYFSDGEGRVSCCGTFPGAWWFSDGYGDYLRHFSWAMGAVPEWAPAREDHLLRSSSVVQRVRYGPRSVTYRTFARSGRDVLRLSWRPARVSVNGRQLKRRRDLAHPGYTVRALGGGDVVVRVRRLTGQSVVVARPARS